jgi:hypothetical protein
MSRKVRILKDEDAYYSLMDYEQDFETKVNPHYLADYPLGELIEEEYQWINEVKAVYEEMQEFLEEKYKVWKEREEKNADQS